jgi:hypothetical protein
MAAVRPPIFFCKQLFSTAGLDLFCKIFGRLATVFIEQPYDVRSFFKLKRKAFGYCKGSDLTDKGQKPAIAEVIRTIATVQAKIVENPPKMSSLFSLLQTRHTWSPGHTVLWQK